MSLPFVNATVNMSNMFNGFVNLISGPEDMESATNTKFDCYRMFYGCYKLNYAPLLIWSPTNVD